MAEGNEPKPFSIRAINIRFPQQTTIQSGGNFTIDTGIPYQNQILPSFTFLPWALAVTNFYYDSSSQTYKLQLVNLNSFAVTVQTTDFVVIRYASL